MCEHLKSQSWLRRGEHSPFWAWFEWRRAGREGKCGWPLNYLLTVDVTHLTFWARHRKGRFGWRRKVGTKDLKLMRTENKMSSLIQHPPLPPPHPGYSQSLTVFRKGVARRVQIWIIIYWTKQNAIRRSLAKAGEWVTWPHAHCPALASCHTWGPTEREGAKLEATPHWRGVSLQSHPPKQNLRSGRYIHRAWEMTTV